MNSLQSKPSSSQLPPPPKKYLPNSTLGVAHHFRVRASTHPSCSACKPWPKNVATGEQQSLNQRAQRDCLSSHSHFGRKSKASFLLFVPSVFRIERNLSIFLWDVSSYIIQRPTFCCLTQNIGPTRSAGYRRHSGHVLIAHDAIKPRPKAESRHQAVLVDIMAAMAQPKSPKSGWSHQNTGHVDPKFRDSWIIFSGLAAGISCLLCFWYLHEIKLWTSRSRTTNFSNFQTSTFGLLWTWR